MNGPRAEHWRAGRNHPRTETKPLTANSTIGEWLTDPAGGPLVRGLLAQTGASEEMLAPIKGLPLQQLVALSQGQLPQSTVDDLVLQANGGIAAVEDQETGWIEQVTPHRFTGQTVIITGAASGIGRATASGVAREGGTVIAVDISAERLESLKAALPQTDIVAVTGDITRQDDIDGIVATAGPRQCGRTWRVATGIPMPPNMSQVGSARLAPFQQQIPTIATAEQLAASITFLLSDDAINITGAVLPSDGGWSVQ